MKYYELTYLISSDFSEEDLKSLSEKINSHIQEGGGILGEVKTPTKQKLTHPIKKWVNSYSVTLDFYSDSEKIADLEKKLKSEPQILRYMILTKKVPGAEVKIAKKLPPEPLTKKGEKKVELEEIEKKLEEILGE